MSGVCAPRMDTSCFAVLANTTCLWAASIEEFSTFDNSGKIVLDSHHNLLLLFLGAGGRHCPLENLEVGSRPWAQL